MGRSFNHFHKIADNVETNANNILDSYQVWWLDAATQFAPVDKGDLRNSGTMGPGGGKWERTIAFTAAHAIYQEYGTIHMAPQPYLRPAKDALRAAFLRDIKSVFGGA